MNKSIFSNVTAHAQKLYKGAKSIILEDGIFSKSFDDAVNSYAGKHQGVYTNYLKMNKGIGDLDGLERVTSYKGEVLKQANKNIKFAGIGVSDNHSSAINTGVANKLAYETSGYGSKKGVEKSYKGELRKAKASITGGTAKNMVSNYYMSPLLDGIGSMKSTSFKDNKNLHKAIGRIGGAALIGGTAVGAVVTNARNDKELEVTNNRLLSKYNEGEL